MSQSFKKADGTFLSRAQNKPKKFLVKFHSSPKLSLLNMNTNGAEGGFCLLLKLIFNQALMTRRNGSLRWSGIWMGFVASEGIHFSW